MTTDPRPVDPRELWQVGLWRRTPGGQVKPVVDLISASLLMTALTGDSQLVEAVDPESAAAGVWLVTLPPEQQDWLRTNGHLRLERDEFWLEAELP